MVVRDDTDEPIIDVLTADAVSSMTKDARIVGLRWDLLEWDLVLDLDCPVSEAADAAYSRGWLVFRSVADISFPLAPDVRLPNGIWAASETRTQVVAARLREYSITLLVPAFGRDEQLMGQPARTARVRSEMVIGLRTRAHAQAGPAGLAYETRQRLAPDSLLRRVAARAIADIEHAQ